MLACRSKLSELFAEGFLTPCKNDYVTQVQKSLNEEKYDGGENSLRKTDVYS